MGKHKTKKMRGNPIELTNTRNASIREKASENV